MMAALLLSPVVMKLLGALAAVGAILAVYFGIKRKGAVEERARQEQKQVQEQHAVQVRVDDARAQDVVIDQKAQARVAALAPAPEPPPAAPPKAGDQFKFIFALVALTALLGGCAPLSLFAAPVHVRVEVPQRPALPACPEAPHPTGAVVQTEKGLAVQLPMDEAMSIRVYLKSATACTEIHDTLLLAHIEKLEDRLKALSPTP